MLLYQQESQDQEIYQGPAYGCKGVQTINYLIMKIGT
ncbi:MAG: hypothetical protein CM15mP13_3430 [Pseudomonadota bacterium]|nr:MAG: hypothetical protein CM15mP13_3430 [Pseudomonadota bacterium]